MRREAPWALIRGTQTGGGIWRGIYWTAIERSLTGEKTVVERSRECDAATSMIRKWARRSEAGATTAAPALVGISVKPD